MKEMAWWLENKTAEFGEGKTYNTTVEQLLEEMERSRDTPLANMNKLKNEAKSVVAVRSKKQMSHNIKVG